jgi:hypothetical protein
VTFIQTRQTNPCTERQLSQQSEFFEFDWTHELNILGWNRRQGNVSKGGIPMNKTSPMHIPISSKVNKVSSLSLLGIEPMTWLDPEQTEWQGNASKHDIHANKTDQSLYRAPAQSTKQVLQLCLELLNPWVDYNLMEQNGKEMWASMTFIRKRQTDPRTEQQRSQRRQFSKFARNWTRELIIICSNRMARMCEQAYNPRDQDKPIHVQRLW